MRRVFDGTLALLALIAASPVLLAVALAIVITSPGNPLYPAQRIGKGGRPFRMWKFRTMVANASSLGPAITGQDDSRIIPIGRFLRRSKLDEIPQFINVLLGDMSLVGPRPESPEIVALYRPDQREILSVKPGMTGRVQLRGEESDSIPSSEKAADYYVRHLMERKLRSDLEYIRSRTLLSDTQILFATAVYVFRSVLGR